MLQYCQKHLFVAFVNGKCPYCEDAMHPFTQKFCVRCEKTTAHYVHVCVRCRKLSDQAIDSWLEQVREAHPECYEEPIHEAA